MALDSVEASREGDGALERISHVLRGLDNTLVELGEVESMLEQESMKARNDRRGESVDGVDLLLVAGTLRRMVGAMMNDVKADPEVQKLLPVAIQKDLNEPTITITGAEACIPDSGSGDLNMTSAKSRVSCEHCGHGLVLDPLVWNKLPDHLLVLVLARLPLPDIFLVPRLSKAWLATSKTPSFRKLCAASQYSSKLFGIVSLPSLKGLWLIAYNVYYQKWHYRELVTDVFDRPVNLVNPGFAHDGGLVCFINDEQDSILICNPLTDLWRNIPLLDHGGIKRSWTRLQLVRNVETGCYTVMVVYGTLHGGLFAADCYNSSTGLWSTVDHGCVYASQYAQVFDCEKLESCTAEVNFESYTALQDHLFVMHEMPQPDDSNHYDIMELAIDGATATFTGIHNFWECGLPMAPQSYKFKLFACSRFILLAANNSEIGYPYHHQFLRLVDMNSEDQWQDVPLLKNGPYGYGPGMLKPGFDGVSFMCDLRWDAVP
ncbi:hypothetical protein M758_5G132300 [Ceratodon purpureus]|nr:hypothetical protein M758_5G132300 [Ceratodon purpureus]